MIHPAARAAAALLAWVGAASAAPPAIREPPAAQRDWMLAASVDYDVNIANATTEQVSVLARPHLNTLSGRQTQFLSGGEVVFQVSCLNSGDIKPYPFGIKLVVTPTLLRSPDERGRGRVLMEVEADDVSSIVVLLTPRSPARIDEERNRRIEEFIERRRAYVEARLEGGAAVERFKERYPDWYQPRPNRLASHLFLMQNSSIYRQVSGDDLRTEALETKLWVTDTADEARRERD